MSRTEVENLKSKWMVTSQYIDDIPHFAVYRLRNINEIDHSGNREYYGGYTPDEDEAEALANKLNEKEQ